MGDQRGVDTPVTAQVETTYQQSDNIEDKFLSRAKQHRCREALPSPTLLESVLVTWNQVIETGCSARLISPKQAIQRGFLSSPRPRRNTPWPTGAGPDRMGSPTGSTERKAYQVAEALAAILRSGGSGIPGRLGILMNYHR
jgi:hypothetical protein